MKTRSSLLFLAAGFFLVTVAGTGCVTSSRDQSINYLQRPLRVAIVPGVNRTDQPEATMVFDKAWEEALSRRNYQVVSADRVVSYGGASGQSLPRNWAGI
jgi:ABC-type phosphate/phosphonate transport system substrate-binding protein